MGIHFTKIFGVLAIAMGIAWAGYWGGYSNTENMESYFAIIFMVLGIYMITRKYLLINSNTIIIKQLLSTKKVKYKFNHYREIIIDGDKIYIQRELTRERVKFNRKLANTHDWLNFNKYIQANQKPPRENGKRTT